MPVTFNNKTNSTTKIFNHITSGEDRYLIVYADSEKVGSGFTTCTYNGYAMTMLYAEERDWGSIKIWGLANPAVGQNEVHITGGGSDNFGAIAISYNGVCADTPIGTILIAHSDNDIPSTLTPDCLLGDAVCSILHSAAYASTVPGTLRAKMSFGTSKRGEVADKPGPSPAMHWVCTSGHYYLVAIPLLSAAPFISDVQLSSGTILGHKTVYVTGRNLLNATDVQFGDAPAAYNVDSDNQITVTTPPHVAGSVVVSVTTPGGVGTFSGYEFVSPIPPTNTDALKNMRLNDKGIVYTSGAAARSGVVSARFFAPSDDGVCLGYTPRYGLIVNYYQESTYDVAARLGIAQEDVTTDISQDNGIFAIYSPVEVDGLPGVVLYYYNEGKPVRFLSAQCVLPLDTWHWLKLSFIDGHIQFSTRVEGVVDWTVVIDTVYREDKFPWQPETFGRSGIYLENVTSHVASFGFYSDDTIVPVHDLSILGPGLDGKVPEADSVNCMSGLHIMVDDEIIVTNGASLAVISADDTTEMVAIEAYFRHPGSFNGYPINVSGQDNDHADNFYNDCALIMSAGGAKGKAFKITGYDAIGPEIWVPTGEYTLPDTWQDHVGDVAHGSWQASDVRRIYVAENPDGYVTFDDTCKIQIVPGLLVTTRGHDDTGASTHDASVASIYSDKATLCNWADFYTCDADWTLESIIRYIVEGAGGKCSFGSFVDGNVTPGGGNGISSWYGSDGLSLRSFVAELTLPSMSVGDEVGIVFHSLTNEAGAIVSPAYYITIQLDEVGYWAVLRKYEGEYIWSSLERMPISFTPQGKVLISVQDQVFSMWVNGLLVASFNDQLIDVGPYVAFYSATPKTFHVRIGELCDFISMWAIDASSNANQVLGEVISDRRVYFSDAGNGGLFFYRLRRDAGTMPDIGLNYQIGDSADVVTWTRGEGAKFIEDADPDLLAKYGLRYQLVNTRWALNVDETIRFARWYRKDQEARAGTVMAEIIAHSRYQVGDYLTIAFPTRTKIVDLIGVTLKLEVTEQSITCTEQLEGIGHAVL